MNATANACSRGLSYGRLSKMRFAQGRKKYRLHEFIVMPNHVHVLVTPLGEHTLFEALQEGKSVSARHINRTLGLGGEFCKRRA